MENQLKERVEIKDPSFDELKRRVVLLERENYRLASRNKEETPRKQIPAPSPVLRETKVEKAQTPNPKKQAKPNPDISQNYMKKMLLQFFLTEEKDRESMIPIILKFVGCDDMQVLCAKRKWSETHSFINKGWF